MKLRDKVKNVIAHHPYQKEEAIEKWFEGIILDILEEIKEEQTQNLSEKADKIDIKLLIERSDEKFQQNQKEMNTRFEAMQKEMNLRFEVMNTRFDSLQKEMNIRFDATQKESNARFESLEKRFLVVQWMIGVGFTLLAIMMTLFNFIKK